MLKSALGNMSEISEFRFELGFIKGIVYIRKLPNVDGVKLRIIVPVISVDADIFGLNLIIVLL